jgi:hypothetical protein
MGYIDAHCSSGGRQAVLAMAETSISPLCEPERLPLDSQIGRHPTPPVNLVFKNGSS